ncbi:MAG: protein DpdJ [Pseudonocardiaceae bacterium]
MDKHLLEALTAIELREAELLSWGAVGAEWTADEIRSVLSEHGVASDLLDQLLEAALVVPTPTGGYRSRSAETVRLLATLRQAFPGRRVTDGRSLVLDYRFLHRPRRRPRRNVPAGEVLAQLRTSAGQAGSAVAARLLPPKLSGFQRRSTGAVLEALRSTNPSGVMVTAGTGSGKTLAFYLPLLTWLADRVGSGQRPGTLALALYPRSELLKDQLRVLVEYVTRLDAAGDPHVPALSLATWFGPTPSSAFAVRQGWAPGWAKRGRGYVCPYLRCLNCDGDLLWLDADLVPGRERLVCHSSACGWVLDGRVLRLTRDSAQRQPADLMLSTTESLNRQLSAPGNLRAFGIRPAALAAVLLDEVHTYEGTTGAQNAVLLRRLRHALGRAPVWVGLSATLRNAGDFFARLAGLPAGAVTVVQPESDELEESGAEYLLALRHDPHSQAGTLSTSIQACMALVRCLDSSTDNPADPPPSSSGIFGSRLFAFTDKLDTTNRLYWDLLDAEGWKWPEQPHRRRVLTLAHLRGDQQGRMEATHQEPPAHRDPGGQWWWLPEWLGHGVEADRQLRVGRTSSQDRGVAGDAQVVVATATLEVGFDDDRVGAVLQHKAPHDAAQFLQRKGRAGRNTSTRPWTVVVLSDWGRDRQTWEAYDALFDPDLPPRNLPVENLYVLRIQAVYALLDWLAKELRYADGDSTWTDLAGPASALYPHNKNRQTQTLKRQKALSELLARLLRPGPERERFRRHLQLALGLGRGEFAESVVDSLLWDSPRPVLLAVVPTMRRQLEEQWRGEEPQAGDTGLQTRTPLRQFVPGNLFDALLVPDVELKVPGLRGQVEVEHLSALRAVQEFCPGNVTRHFGVWASNKRHWLPLPAEVPGEGGLQVDVRETYRATLVDVVGTGSARVAVYAPVAATLQPVDDDVKDATAVRPDWEFHVSPLGSGCAARLGRGVDRLLAGITAHLHVQGGGVRTLRYARTAHGTVWDPRPRPVRLDFGRGEHGGWACAALGVDVHCDALECVVSLPGQVLSPTPPERAERLRQRLEVEATLPATMSSFDRKSLVEVVILAVVVARLDGEDLPAERALPAALASAAETLGLTGAAQQDGHDEDHPDGDEENEDSWGHWLTDPAVLSAIRDAVQEISAPERSPAWTDWWRRRYTLSVAHLVLAALSALCPGVDTDELVVDLAPEDDNRFFLSEPSPGGTGQVEAFHRVLVQEPEAFKRAIEDALSPSATETMDEELTVLLRCEVPEVRSALADLREAWRGGHTAVSRAVERVDQAARAQDLSLGSPARTALSTRLAGPGAHPDLLSTVASWLDLRDLAAQRAGLEVNARTLGALLAGDELLDEVLRLCDGVSRQRRARAVSNVLWPWGRAAQASVSYNPYAPVLHSSIQTVRAHVELGPTVLDVVPWSDERRNAVHAALIEQGEVVLRARHPDRTALRAVVLDLQTRPVEVGTLLCHPVVVGLGTSVRFVLARVLLREAP